MIINVHVKDYAKRTAEAKAMGFDSLEHYWMQWIKRYGTCQVRDDHVEYQANNPKVLPYIAELLTIEWDD